MARWTFEIGGRLAVALVAIAMGVSLVAVPAEARRDAGAFMQRLAPDERKAFESWLVATTFHDAQLDAFWAKVSKKRSNRRLKKRKSQLVTERDYVNAYPPKYDGPELSKALRQKWLAYQNEGKSKETKKRTELPGLDDYLRAAKRYYDFTPERIPEREFKRRYAREALRLGLNPDQVVRVYALETSGLGTADMQAGIHPIRRTGRPISSALGYAQLLAANSVNELQKHGKTFLRRLRAIYAIKGLSDKRNANLRMKIAALERMMAQVSKIPRRWSAHRKFARTGPGMGIHPINIDGDIGPWLQVIKLKGVFDIAKRAGRGDIEPAELELMNLAGPGTGLEMMTSVGLNMSTVNFFSRRAYERNTIVRGKTSRELIVALDKRMDVNVKNSGAVEFYEVFAEEKAAGRRASGR